MLLPLCVVAAAGDRYLPGQILVKTRPTTAEGNFQTTLRSHAAVQRRAIGRDQLRVIHLNENRADALLAALRRDPAVEFAERDFLAEAAVLPNDPFVQSGSAWQLAKTQTPAAWNTTTGGNVIVAILDSGVNFQHPDLAANLLAGYDFVGYDNDATDDFGHGTSVAGVVAAVGNNGLGLAGVAYGAKILPVKVMDAFGYAAYSAIAEGIYFAVDHGARVINLSIAGSAPSSALQSAIDYAWSNQVIVVAAAGNTGGNTPQYPAACAHVLAVSATTTNDTLAAFSSSGTHLALAAPGERVLTTARNLASPYATNSGTSLASPVVAATAALVLAANPRLSADEIGAVLTQSADDLGPSGFDSSFGFGRVNAQRAVTTALSYTSPPPAIVGQPTNQIVWLGGTATFAVTAANSSAAVYQWRFNLAPIAGATNSVLACTNTQLAQAGYYSVVIANTSGSVTSQVAALAVTLPLPPQMLPLTRTATNTTIISWTAVPGRTYRVQAATNLAAPVWVTLTPDVVAAGGVASLVVPPNGAPARFFRTVMLP